MTSTGQRFAWGTPLLLGLVSIAAYGAWYYAFGVLLDPILADTGWGEGWLSGGFALAAAGGGLLAIPAGRLLDHLGARPVFALAAVISTAGLWVAAGADSLAVFTAASVIGAAALAGLGFYHITQTAAVRAAPLDPTRAIALVTIIGAFSSTLYIPFAAYLVTQTDWRTTIRVLAATTGAVLLMGALAVRERDRPDRDAVRPRLSDDLTRPEVRRYVIANGCIGAAVGVILVYQVPLMTGAGLPLALAAWLAGARGAAQVTVRLPLTWIVRRLGARRALRMAFAFITAGIGLLTLAASPAAAGAYALVAGFGIGATSPLQGVYADELFDRATLGASMGAVTTVFGLAGAIGPAAVGWLAGATGSRWWAIGVALAMAGTATLILRETRPADITHKRRQA